MKSNIWSPSGLVLFSAAVLAGIIAGTLVSAVVLLFQSRGTPFELSAAAERACVQYVYKSERDACIKDWVATKRSTSVANR